MRGTGAACRNRLQGGAPGLLDQGPLPLPRDWRRRVQLLETEGELAAL
jgi:hypothetical protein